MSQSNAVYEITCSQCTMSYAGETSRHLQQRLKEHIGSIQWTFEKKHFHDWNVSPSFEMVKILGKEKFDKSLTLEVLFISEFKPALKAKDEFNFFWLCFLFYIRIICDAWFKRPILL